MSRVFVYGSLLRGLHNHRVLKDSSCYLPGALTSKSFVLVDSAQGYPYAVHSRNLPEHSQAPILGEVYTVSDSVLAALDDLEEHPCHYRRELVDIDGEESAWMYILCEPDTLAKLRTEEYRDVTPPGDWRTYHQTKGDAAAVDAILTARAATWAATRRTATMPGPHAVFSYGSNGISQLRERVRNETLAGQPAVLEHACRVFAGAAKRWGDGAVASIVPCVGHACYGNVAMLTDDELLLLDGYERGTRETLSADPYEADGVYRRQDVRVRLFATPADVVAAAATIGAGGDAGGTMIDAVAYVKVDLDWVRPPHESYVAACKRNLDEFWPGQEMAVEVRDGHRRLRS